MSDHLPTGQRLRELEREWSLAQAQRQVRAAEEYAAQKAARKAERFAAQNAPVPALADGPVFPDDAPTP